MPQNGWKTQVLLAGSWRGATCTLLSNGRHHLLVDTGMPHEAHLLVEALERHGLKPGDISAVINTHFHVDHVLNNSLFPGSLIYASQECHDWCSSLYSDLRDDQHWEKLAMKYYPEASQYEPTQTHMHQLRRFALRWWDVKRLGDPSQFRWLETSSLPDGLVCRITSGHVPGHASILVQGAEGSVVVAGDALLSREHEENVLTMIPVNRHQFERERAEILRLGERIVPGHDQEFPRGAPSAPGATGS